MVQTFCTQDRGEGNEDRVVLLHALFTVQSSGSGQLFQQVSWQIWSGNLTMIHLTLFANQCCFGLQSQDVSYFIYILFTCMGTFCHSLNFLDLTVQPWEYLNDSAETYSLVHELHGINIVKKNSPGYDRSIKYEIKQKKNTNSQIREIPCTLQLKLGNSFNKRSRFS